MTRVLRPTSPKPISLFCYRAGSLHQHLAKQCWRFDDVNAGGFHGLHLLSGSSLPSGDDCTGVPHAASGRRSLASDEADDWLFYVGLDELGCVLFGVAADLADHDDCFGLGIFIKEIESIDEVGADNRVATDTDCGRSSDTANCELVHSFVGKRAGAGD